MTIGIPGWAVGPNSFGVTIPYVEFCREYLGCNDLRILLPDSPIWTDLDLIILPGGADVNPARYDETPSFYTDKPDIIKEYFDVRVLPRYIEQRVPLFGICRGIQTLAVHFGGKLNQNMYHETNKQDDPFSGVHTIRILADWNAKNKIKVNSKHHQCVIPPSGDSQIEVLAVHSSFSHHVEAIRIKDYPAAACQWHPEDLDEASGVNYAIRLIDGIIKK
jgi:putative glutamine amidotransferase